MKRHICFFLLACSIPAYAMQSGGNLEEGYYITVGVYAKSKEAYARLYTTELLAKDYTADYGFSPSRNHFYVYLFFSANYRLAADQAARFRKEGAFSDAWVYVHLASVVPQLLTAEQAEIIEATEKSMKKKVVKNLNDLYAERFKEVKTGNRPQNPKEFEEHVYENGTEKLNLWFNAFSKNRKISDPLEVQIIDAERARLVKISTTGDLVTVTDPGNGTGNLALILDAFGYESVQLPFNYYYPDTTKPYLKKGEDHYTVEFALERYHKGQISPMHNLSFKRNTAILTKESKKELDLLVEMMEENKAYVIRINGYTAGYDSCRMIIPRNRDQFFTQSENDIESWGSAIDLSTYRLQTIRKFLMNEGVDEYRVKVKAWAEPLDYKPGILSDGDSQIEVEILED